MQEIYFFIFMSSARYRDDCTEFLLYISLYLRFPIKFKALFDLKGIESLPQTRIF